MPRLIEIQALVGLGFGLCSALAGSVAHAAVLRVPDQHATIQAAVDSAHAGDVIRVESGSYCGATIDKPLTLLGIGNPTIVGCDSSPTTFGGEARIGFLLPGVAGTSAANGSQISGFSFDGRGISNTNRTPLAFGILGRFATDVQITGNRFFGTVQGITNTAGDRWLIAHNRMEDLTLFDCTGLCAGGDGVVVQNATGSPLAAAGGAASPLNRPEGNLVLRNFISGTIPDNFHAFAMVGVMLLAGDGTAIAHNHISIPDNPTSRATGEAVLVTNICCGDPTPLLPGSRNTLVAFNDGRNSQFGVVVEGTGGQNTQGLLLLHNSGVIFVEGVVQEGRTHVTKLQLGKRIRHWFF